MDIVETEAVGKERAHVRRRLAFIVPGFVLHGSFSVRLELPPAMFAYPSREARSAPVCHGVVAPPRAACSHWNAVGRTIPARRSQRSASIQVTQSTGATSLPRNWLGLVPLRRAHCPLRHFVLRDEIGIEMMRPDEARRLGGNHRRAHPGRTAGPRDEAWRQGRHGRRESGRRPRPGRRSDAREVPGRG